MEKQPKTALNRSSEYQPIWDALRPYLERGVRTIHIWDGGHGEVAPRAILADAGLYELMAAYGTPLYVSEVHSTRVDGKSMADIALSQNPDTTRLPAILAAGAQGYGLQGVAQEKYVNAVMDIMRLAHAGDALVVGPDARMALLDSSFSVDEKRLMSGLQRAAATATNADEGTRLFFQYRDALSAPEQAMLDAALHKFKAIASSGGTPESMARADQAIVASVEAFQRESQHHGVRVTQFGALHYMKNNDINEHMQGVSLAVAARPGSMGEFNHLAGGGRDTPNLVWYEDTKRLVTLNTPEAIQEFWGDVAAKQALPTLNNVRGGQDCTAEQASSPCAAPMSGQPKRER